MGRDNKLPELKILGILSVILILMLAGLKSYEIYRIGQAVTILDAVAKAEQDHQQQFGTYSDDLERLALPDRITQMMSEVREDFTISLCVTGSSYVARANYKAFNIAIKRDDAVCT